MQAFNALLDQCAVEKTCLFPSKDEAERACLVGASGNYQVRRFSAPLGGGSESGLRGAVKGRLGKGLSRWRVRQLSSVKRSEVGFHRHLVAVLESGLRDTWYSQRTMDRGPASLARPAPIRYKANWDWVSVSLDGG